MLLIVRWHAITPPPVPIISRNSAPTLRASLIAKPCNRAFHLVFTNAAPIPDVTYSAFVDPSGGSAEAMTLAVGHSEDGVVIIDCIRESRCTLQS